MRKFLCALAALFLLGACARAETGDFRAGTSAAYLNGNLFFCVDEGATGALVRVNPAAVPLLADRAEAIGPAVAVDTTLYYLRARDGAWEICARGADTEESVVYAFDAGADVRALGAYGGDLIALVDGCLNAIDPDQGQCRALSDARMSECVVAGDYAYFVSGADIVGYELPAPGGATASGEGGCLYRLNLSTGNTSLLLKAGAEDLKFFSGALYFHNLSDGYLSGTRVAGRLYRYDLASETLARLLDDYDWDYFPTDAGLLVYRLGTVTLIESGTVVCAPGPRAQVAVSDGRVLVYDPDAGTFESYAIAP